MLAFLLSVIRIELLQLDTCQGSMVGKGRDFAHLWAVRLDEHRGSTAVGSCRPWCVHSQGDVNVQLACSGVHGLAGGDLDEEPILCLGAVGTAREIAAASSIRPFFIAEGEYYTSLVHSVVFAVRRSDRPHSIPATGDDPTDSWRAC